MVPLERDLVECIHEKKNDSTERGYRLRLLLEVINHLRVQATTVQDGQRSDTYMRVLVVLISICPCAMELIASKSPHSEVRGGLGVTFADVNFEKAQI